MGFESRALTIAKENQGSFDSFTPWKLNWEKGYPYNNAILSPHIIINSIHFQSGGPASICNKMYYGEDKFDLKGEPFCEDCLKPGYQGKGKNRPTCVFCAVGFVFDLVDKEGTSSKGSKFKENPEKIIEVSGGKGQANFDNLNQAMAADPAYLAYTEKDKVIWRMKRQDEGGMIPPFILSDRDVKQAKLKLEALTPDILAKYSKMSRQEVQGLILSAYGNLRKDLLEPQGFIFPTPPEAQAEEATGEDPTKSLDS